MLDTRFSAVILPNAANTKASSGRLESSADRGPRLGCGGKRRHAHADGFDMRPRIRLAQFGRNAWTVDRDGARRIDHRFHHGPQVIDRAAESFDGPLRDGRVHPGVVVLKFLAVLGDALAVEQAPRARVVQPGVVQDDETRIAREVGPHVVVAGGVAQVVDDEVVGRASCPPDEVVRHVFGIRIDLESPRQLSQQLGAVGRDAGSLRRKRRKPGKTHGLVVVVGCWLLVLVVGRHQFKAQFSG